MCLVWRCGGVVWLHGLLVLLCQLLNHHHHALAQEQDQPPMLDDFPAAASERELPDGVNEGMYYDEGYAFYEHPLPEEPDPVGCYTCHYSRTPRHEQGMKNCDEPFDVKAIPVIACKGLCAVTRTTLAPDDYMIIRSCLPNCKDFREPDSSVECCEGERCNGRKAGTFIVASSLGALGAVFLAGLIFSLCYFKPT